MRFGSFYFHVADVRFCRLRCDTNWSALMLLPLCRVDLRVPVDPMVMASDASLTGGASCKSMGLPARGLGSELPR